MLSQKNGCRGDSESTLYSLEEDMGTGKNRTHTAFVLVRFGLPLIFSGILQQLYSWADAFIVGRVEGETPLASIGATAAITEFFILSITGFTLGLSILAAQMYGKDQSKEIRRILSSFAILLGGIFVLLAVFGSALAGPVLTLANTPADMFHFSMDYLRIILMGIPFLAVYNTYSSVLRAMGDSKAPFYAVFISSAMNVFLDILFVVVLHKGVAGAAIATVISQIAMTCFIILYSIRKHPVLRFSIQEKMLHWDIIKQGCKLGFPPAIQSSVTSLGNIILQNFMNGFGTHTVAAVTCAYRIDSIMLLPIVNLGSAISTMVAQSKGAGRQGSIKGYLGTGMAMMAVISLFLSAVMILFGGRLVSIFGLDTEAIGIGHSFFRSIAVFYIFYGMATAFRGAVEGMGDVVYSSMAGIAALCIRIMLSYLFAAPLANMAIPYAEGVCWIFMMLFFVPRIVVRGRELEIQRLPHR